MKNELTITTDNQLIISDNETITLEAIRPLVDRYREINASLVFDYRDKDGNKKARSHVAMLRKAKSPIESVHKRGVAELKAITGAMDKSKRELINIVEEMIEYHAAPLAQIKAEEEEAAKAELIRLEIEFCIDHAWELNAFFTKQKEVERVAAEQAKVAEAQAAAQAEIDRQAREKKIAEDAADNARLQAEAKAAQEIAYVKATAQADKNAQEEISRILAEAERQAMANTENRKRINRTVLAAIIGYCKDEEAARGLIISIAEGNIPFASIDYTKILDAVTA